MSKLIRACVVLAAFAAVLPATASAINNPQLTEGPLSAGVKIVALSVGNTLFTDTSGNTLVDCSNAKLAGTLLNNSAGGLEVELTTFDFRGTGTVSAHSGLPECTGSFGNAYITVANSPFASARLRRWQQMNFKSRAANAPAAGKLNSSSVRQLSANANTKPAALSRATIKRILLN